MKRIILITIGLIIFSGRIYAYDSGKNPWGAMALSAFIPGGGQYYNESYYKAVGVFALEGYFIGSLLYNHNQVNRYYDKAQGAAGEDFLYYQIQHNKYFDRRQNDIWWLGSIIFLSIVDAFVDAHLYNYEEEKEAVYLLFDDKVFGIGIRW